MGQEKREDQKEKCWFLYMVRTACNRLYTGITTDIDRRFKEHLATADGVSTKGAKYFRGKQIEEIVYKERFPDRSSASKREAYIKSLSKNEKEKMIASSMQR
jgi:putative endonuclease